MPRLNFPKPLFCMALCLLTPVASADLIRIGGTGSAMETMRQLGDAFSKAHPEHSIKVLPSLGSGGGIKALQGKALEIAVTGRGLEPKEAASGLVATEYGITPFVFAVHRNVPVDNISLKEIAAIYSGQKQKWDNGEIIRPVLRPAGDSDTVLLLAISPEIASAVNQALQRQGMVFAITDIDSADNLEELPGSFGTTTLALIASEDRRIKPLSIDGVAPNAANLKNGSYRYWKPFNMVTSKSASAATEQFIAFVKSAEGQKILKATGHHITP